MKAFWMKFNGLHPASCVEAENKESATTIAEEKTGKKVSYCEGIPYPASPRLNQYVNPVWGVPCPSFCYKPEQCVGRTSCPQRYSCTE